MKKALRIVLYFLGAVALLLILIFSYFQIKGIPSYETVQIEYTVEATPERLERGQVLVGSLCIG